MFKKICKLIIIIGLVLILPYGIIRFLNENELMSSNTPINVDTMLREYCIQQLSKEVTPQYADEMLKVQAILVRTTVYKEIEELGEKFLEEKITQEEEIDLIYRQKLEKAWDETEGQVAMYGEKLALVPFHQVSNGKTRNGEEVLGSKDYPYLQVVECQRDVEAENQLKSSFIEETGILIEEWDSAGYVTSVSVAGEKMSGEAFREKYQLASSCFEVQEFENRTRVITKGVGHGLGLSQFSANKMAEDGKTSEEILQFFFPGTEIKEVAEILWNIE